MTNLIQSTKCNFGNHTLIGFSDKGYKYYMGDALDVPICIHCHEQDSHDVVQAVKCLCGDHKFNQVSNKHGKMHRPNEAGKSTCYHCSSVKGEFSFSKKIELVKFFFISLKNLF